MPEEHLKVTNELWGRPEIIDDYVRDNPMHLSASQLATVKSWRSVLCGKMVAVRVPAHGVCMLTDGYLISVTGISTEIEEMLPELPCFIGIALLPFEGRIVYPINFSTYSISIGPGMLSMLEKEVNDILAAGKIITTAEQLIELVPSILETRVEEESRRMLEQLESDLDTGPAPGTFRGALADIDDFDERMEAAYAYMRDGDSNDTFAKIREETLALWISDEISAASLAELLAGESVEMLLYIADLLGIEDAELQPAKKLAALIAEKIPDAQDAGRFMLSSLDSGRLERLHTLVEAGGRIEYAHDALPSLGDVPHPMGLFCYLFDEEGSYVFVMPEEVLQLCKSLDLDEIEAELVAGERIVRFASACTELRGVVSMDECYDEFCRVNGVKAPQIEFVDSVLDGAYGDLGSYEIFDDGDEVWLVSFMFVDYDDPDHERGTTQRRALPAGARAMLAARAGKDPRPIDPAMFAMRDGYFDWAIRQPAVVALTRYLDANVPNSKNEYYFADRIIERVVDMSHGGYQVQDYLEMLSDEGAVADESQLNRVLELLMNAINSLPRWDNNGWAPNELLGAKLGRKLFFSEDGSPMKVGRNDPCPCGSGKKYKKCCGR